MALDRNRLLPQLLRLLPRRLIAALDEWSYRVARSRAEQRRRRFDAAGMARASRSGEFQPSMSGGSR
ncbi:MAG: hypothetical protein JWQ13_325 [Ramlibacter sp.]|jgi:hypothetical protein|nr:hypothetical protein [Ramlibacter sp.]